MILFLIEKQQQQQWQKKQCNSKSINNWEYISSTKYRKRSDDMRTFGLARHCYLLGNSGIFPVGKMWIRSREISLWTHEYTFDEEMFIWKKKKDIWRIFFKTVSNFGIQLLLSYWCWWFTQKSSHPLLLCPVCCFLLCSRGKSRAPLLFRFPSFILLPLLLLSSSPAAHEKSSSASLPKWRVAGSVQQRVEAGVEVS